MIRFNMEGKYVVEKKNDVYSISRPFYFSQTTFQASRENIRNNIRISPSHIEILLFWKFRFFR